MNINDIAVWVALISIGGNVFQFFLNRKYQRRDQLNERRYQAYSTYMRKSDELMHNLRTDPSMLYGISGKLMTKLNRGDKEETDRAMEEFCDDLAAFTKRACEPLLILNAELKQLELVCSKKVIRIIEDTRKLALDYNEAFQLAANNINPQNIQKGADQFTALSQDPRAKKLSELNEKLTQLMRKELEIKD